MRHNGSPGREAWESWEKTGAPVGRHLTENIFQVEFNTMFLEKDEKFVFEADFAMMFGLVQNISLYRRNV